MIKPFLPGSACTDPVGRRTHTAYMDKANMITLAAALATCTRCPALTACAEWVLRDEQPAGSWSGVYGGLSPVERANA